MADNLGVTPGTGAIVAADEIGGLLFQRIKLIFGADGVDSGDVSVANPLPVVDGEALSGAVFDATFGSVEPSPSANTVLARLKDITDALAGTLSIDAASLPLPPDAATNTTLATLLSESNFDAKVGEVAASPTANTVLGRLKNINDTLGGGLSILGTVTANAGTDLNTSNLLTEAVFSGVDFATQTTLATLLTESTFSGTDFSTETTLAALNAKLVTGTVIGDVNAIQSGPWDINDISGTISLPTGAATELTLSSLDGKDFATQTTLASLLSAVQGVLTIEGDIAHDAADSGNPVKQGFHARSTNRARVADGDRSDGISDLAGRQVTVLNQVLELTVHQHTQLTNTTETTILAAGAAGVFHDLVYLRCSNQSNLPVDVTIKDATSGTTRSIISLGPRGTVRDSFTVPVTQSSAAKNWRAVLSASSRTVSIFVQAVKNI